MYCSIIIFVRKNVQFTTLVSANQPAVPMATNATRIQVLMSDQEAGRFDAYCAAKGFKKSTLIARLIREYLDRENFKAGEPQLPAKRR